jgi:hypothetical protein
VEKALHGLFPLGQHPKTPRVFGVAVRRILRRMDKATRFPQRAVFRGGSSGFHVQVGAFRFPIIADLGEDGGCEPREGQCDAAREEPKLPG